MWAGGSRRLSLTATTRSRTRIEPFARPLTADGLRATTRGMQARVYVTLKPGVLDPQGKAVRSSLTTLGFAGVSDVRLGKYLEVTLARDRSGQGARGRRADVPEAARQHRDRELPHRLDQVAPAAERQDEP